MSQTESRNTDLFVYVSWKTTNEQPLLSDEQIRQAAALAIKTRTRIQRCRVLAISETCTQIEVVFRFPASLSVSQLAQTAMQAAGEAVAQLFETLYSRRIDTALLWDRQITVYTLSTGDAAEAQAYLCRQTVCQEDALNDAPTIPVTTLV